ncbi:MAG: LysM peptidoglycan-binding domain-containing protein [Candidatus Melainabacteria bacterium]|nr:MAG: LysM peptidoglycan-binding domain-containing protein [Candidatus Melainabacteria bacterium]
MPNPKGDLVIKGGPHNPPAFVNTPEFQNFKAANPDLTGRDLVRGYFSQAKADYLAQNRSMEGFNQKMFGDNVPGWAQRRFGEGGDFVMRDPTKMPGFDIGGGDKMHRNMIEFWKGIQGMKPGDSLNGLLDLMNGRMNGKDIMRLSDFLTGQLGRKGSDALGMQDIMNLSTLFKGFGDRAGLSMQFGDNRSGLMMSFGLNGRFDFQIRFGALTLGFGDRGQTGLQQIGRLLFTSDGRQTQASLGTGGLRAGDILSRGFTGQGQGQWNPFGPGTGDGALRTTQLTASLTQGNRDLINTLRDNSARLNQQLDASKLAQMSKTPGLLPGDFKPGQLDPGGKGQILQNFDPLRQDAGRLQPGQRLDGPRILTGNIEMDGRALDGMGGRRGPLTAAAHEASMKGDLQNLQGKGDQLLPGAKLPGEKLTIEEEAAKKKLEEEKKKGDLRSGEQFIQDEQERKAKERREQEEDREEELEALSEQDEAKRRALLLILEARRKREKELKEKALKEQITKQEEAKRAQYRVAIGDSLENIATKQLRNPRLAGLIFDINKKVVPIKFMNGKEVAVLNVGAILSLPSVKEIKDFSQAGFTLGPKFNKVDFTMPAVSQQGKTAEDELEAMFGSNWHGTEAGEGQSDLSQNVPQNGKSQEEMDEFTKRRLNIESVLGQMGPKRAADGRMRYTVRLGDTLKSIAMKHPALEDVSSWRLLAELNNFSTETDANDNPKAIVPRGSVLMIPTRAEVEEHKRKMGLRKAIVLPGQSVTTGSALPSLKHCPNCGQKSLHTATTCECGSEFVSDSIKSVSAAANTGAPYMVNQENQSQSQVATNNFLAGTPSKKEDRFELAAKSGHVDGDHWNDIANLDPETRIVKLNSVFDPSLEFSLLLLQALVEGRWLPVAGYEMRENAAIRIDYTDAKSRSTVKIDLPPSAAQDLAKNDLVKNWQNYKRKFVTILPS